MGKHLQKNPKRSKKIKKLQFDEEHWIEIRIPSGPLILIRIMDTVKPK